MTLDEAIGQYTAYVDAEKMGITSFTITTREAEQLVEWLRELKAYREILTNADKIIESEYGCVIVEGYADVIDQMKEVYKRGKC